MSRNIAILILGCASDPYVRLIDAIRDSWAGVRLQGMDIYYVYGRPEDRHARAALSRWIGGEVPTVADGGIRRKGDVLIAGCADLIRRQADCLLRKRLLAFEYLTSDDRYDFVYTVCASSYVDQYELERYARALPAGPFISGLVTIEGSISAPFVSGSSMLLSADVARDLARQKDEIITENRFSYMDDVAIGYWAATRMSRVPLQWIVDDIKKSRPMLEGCIFAAAPHTTVDYRETSAEDFRPCRDVYHYHFSTKADDLTTFHRRYFAHQTCSLWTSFSKE